jgi:hypothetical protein
MGRSVRRRGANPRVFILSSYLRGMSGPGAIRYAVPEGEHWLCPSQFRPNLVDEHCEFLADV